MALFNPIVREIKRKQGVTVDGNYAVAILYFEVPGRGFFVEISTWDSYESYQNGDTPTTQTMVFGLQLNQEEAAQQLDDLFGDTEASEFEEQVEEQVEEVVDLAQEAAIAQDAVINEYNERLEEIRRQYNEGEISEEEARSQKATLDAWLQDQLSELASYYPGIFTFSYQDTYTANYRDWLTGEAWVSYETVSEWIELEHDPAYNQDGYYSMRMLHQYTGEGRGPFDVFINQGGKFLKTGNLEVKGVFDIAGPDSAPIVTTIESDNLQLEVRDKYRVQGSIYFSSTTDKNVLIDEAAVQFNFEAGDSLKLNPARVLRDGKLIPGAPTGIPFIEMLQDDFNVYDVTNLSSIDLTKFRSYSDRRSGNIDTDRLLYLAGDLVRDTWDELRNEFLISIDSVQFLTEYQQEVAYDPSLGQEPITGVPRKGEEGWRHDIRDDERGEGITEDDVDDPYTPFDEDEDGISTGTLSFIGLIGIALVITVIWFTIKGGGKTGGSTGGVQ